MQQGKIFDVFIILTPDFIISIIDFNNLPTLFQFVVQISRAYRLIRPEYNLSVLVPFMRIDIHRIFKCSQ